MAKHGRFERQKEQKVKKGSSVKGWKKGLLIALAVILVLVIAVVIAAVVYYNSVLDKINKVDVPKIDYAALDAESVEYTVGEAIEETTEATTEATTEPTTVPTTEPHVASSADYINILLVGQAARVGEEERFADTMLLCTVNTYEKTLTVTSMLRDTLVQVPGRYITTSGGEHTWGGIKLTVVYHLGYGWGGAAGAMTCMNTTLYNNFGIEVDHNFEVDFDAFMEAINAIGGVDLEITQAEADYLNADDFWVYEDVEPGMAHLDGMTALCFARMRKAAGDNDSDIIRTERQRRLIEAIVAKLKTMSVGDLQKLVDTVLPYVTTSMSNQEITDTMLLLLPILPELQIKTGGTCPANHKGDMLDIYNNGVLHSILRFNEQETKAYMRAITEGEGVVPEE